MLSWSNNGYKFTLGIGSLASAGILAERWKDALPVWAIMAIALLPIVVFVFAHPGELPPRAVRWAHAFASVWYMTAALVLLVSLFSGPRLPRGWVLYPLFAAVGAVPCTIVLSRVARGLYTAPEEAPPEGGA